MSCETAITALRQNNKTKDIPVIVFSAVNHVQKISKKLKATGFIAKTFDIEHLRATVQKHLQ